MSSSAARTGASGGSVTGSTIIPDSERLTLSTSATCAAIERLRWTTPIPPSRASAIARRASVTVSIAAETMGIARLMDGVNRARVETSFGRTCDSAGTRRTSSNVSPSRPNLRSSSSSRWTSSAFSSAAACSVKNSRVTGSVDNVLTGGSYLPPVRFLLVSAGLLVLAGAAIAGRPTAHTLRKSHGGPIAAVAQNDTMAAWLTSGGTKSCNAVHVLSPGKRDRLLPQPSSSGLTCHWTLSDGQPQLAVASHISTALWTLHESGSPALDWVVAASIGGPERKLKSLAHASNGTGDWLGGIAGAGKTLAYSWNDVEYVDPSACLSGGSCKQKLADGGIRIVTHSGDT